MTRVRPVEGMHGVVEQHPQHVVVLTDVQDVELGLAHPRQHLQIVGSPVLAVKALAARC